MGYESDATKFLRQLMAEHPELAALRARNRATWWDRPQDPDLQEEKDAARVPQPPYVYFPRPAQPGNNASTPSSPDTSKA